MSQSFSVHNQLAGYAQIIAKLLCQVVKVLLANG